MREHVETGGVPGAPPAGGRNGAPVAPVLVADRHPLFATGMRLALRARGVPAAALPVDDWPTLIDAAARFSHGVVLLDLALSSRPAAGRSPRRATPDLGGLVWALRTQGKQVLAIAGGHDEAAVAAAITAGAVNVLPRTAGFETLLCALRRAVAGVRQLSETDRARWHARHHRHQQHHYALRERLLRLSPRERALLDALAEGRRAAQVAERLDVSPTTVHIQVRSILAKLDVGSQLDAVALLLTAHPRRTAQP
jgi:DNA-binding NarL/FixJ family response regulator